MTADIRTISDIANAVRGRRLQLGVSQDELSRRAGVSRKWIYEFEAGKAGAEFGIVLMVLEALGMRLALGTAPASEVAGGVDLDALLDDYTQSR
ncbi:MAG TPA: helix-turn-helix domain-containing protein [Candidatus Sulfomarinibacteraceae bacterium]|nr:helix-turn-helix domain-containing protein [Candidatus Sulfomarinibacteraceae bacterium]